jgi:hypothetical protein
MKYLGEWSVSVSVIQKFTIQAVGTSSASVQGTIVFVIKSVVQSETMKYIVSQLSDVEVKDDGYYLQLSDKSDLCQLFKSYGGRETSPRDVVNSLFEDDIWEFYRDTTDNVYRDVIEELNPENIERLKTYMLDVLTNWKIEVDDETPDLFNNYSEDGIFYLTPENVGDVIGDKESFMYLIDNDYLAKFRLFA